MIGQTTTPKPVQSPAKILGVIAVGAAFFLGSIWLISGTMNPFEEKRR